MTPVHCPPVKTSQCETCGAIIESETTCPSCGLPVQVEAVVRFCGRDFEDENGYASRCTKRHPCPNCEEKTNENDDKRTAGNNPDSVTDAGKRSSQKTAPQSAPDQIREAFGYTERMDDDEDDCPWVVEGAIKEHETVAIVGDLQAIEDEAARIAAVFTLAGDEGEPCDVIALAGQSFCEAVARRGGDASRVKIIRKFAPEKAAQMNDGFPDAMLLVFHPLHTIKDEESARNFLRFARITSFSVIYTLPLNSRRKAMGHPVLTTMCDRVITARAEKPAKATARAWLAAFLASGPKTKAEALAQSGAEGFGVRAIEQAAASLGVIAERQAAVHGPVVWRLP